MANECGLDGEISMVRAKLNNKLNIMQEFKTSIFNIRALSDSAFMPPA